MQFDSFTLSEGELGWNVQFPFPSSQRAVIENAIREVNPPAPPYGELDELLAEELATHGYFSEHANDEEVQLWRPEHQHTVDLYSPNHSIAIEIEKTERKRIVHDLLKIHNGGLTFVPRVRYGVIIFPRQYVSGTGTTHGFGTNAVIADLNFYYRPLFARGPIDDILCIAYYPENDD